MRRRRRRPTTRRVGAVCGTLQAVESSGDLRTDLDEWTDQLSTGQSGIDTDSVSSCRDDRSLNPPLIRRKGLFSILYPDIATRIPYETVGSRRSVRSLRTEDPRPTRKILFALLKGLPSSIGVFECPDDHSIPGTLIGLGRNGPDGQGRSGKPISVSPG